MYQIHTTVCVLPAAICIVVHTVSLFIVHIPFASVPRPAGPSLCAMTVFIVLKIIPLVPVRKLRAVKTYIYNNVSNTHCCTCNNY